MNAKEYIHAHPGIRPGHRAYGCSLAISKSGRRMLRQLRPCVVELCSFDRQIEEKWYRDGSSVINYMVPVRPDGTLNWKRPMSIYQEGACLADDPCELIKNITTVVEAARNQIQQLQQQLKKTDDNILKLQARGISDATSTLPPLDNQS